MATTITPLRTESDRGVCIYGEELIALYHKLTDVVQKVVVGS